MTDCELLEKAAKAAGYELEWGEVFIVGDDKFDCTDLSYVVSGQPDEADWHWNPLTDDGDALRLAVKLNLMVDCSTPTGMAQVAVPPHWIREPIGDDPYAATRRAIVRAAAAIGEKP